MTDPKELIEEARAMLAHPLDDRPWRSVVQVLADALEESERWRKAPPALFDETLDAVVRRAETAEAERDALAATLERVRGLLGELDLDSGRVTAPGTAWGSILREAREALDSAPPVSDDTEWEYAVRQHDGHVWGEDLDYEPWERETAFEQAGEIRGGEVVRRRKAGPWAAIEKGGESDE